MSKEIAAFEITSLAAQAALKVAKGEAHGKGIIGTLKLFLEGTPFSIKTLDSPFSPFTPLPAEIVAELRALQDSIIVEEKYLDPHPPREKIRLDTRRLLTEDEIGKILRLAKEYKLPVTFRQYGHFSGFIFTLHDHVPSEKSWPRPRVVFNALDKNIPLENPTGNAVRQAYEKITHALGMPKPWEGFEGMMAFYGLESPPETAMRFEY